MPAYPVRDRRGLAALARATSAVRPSVTGDRWLTSTGPTRRTAGTPVPADDFMAVGRDEIRELALGLEMAGLEGWTYPYQAVLIDDGRAWSSGFWKQVADARQADGSPYEVAGFGASWFGYGGDGLWAWQPRLSMTPATRAPSSSR